MHRESQYCSGSCELNYTVLEEDKIVMSRLGESSSTMSASGESESLNQVRVGAVEGNYASTVTFDFPHQRGQPHRDLGLTLLPRSQAAGETVAFGNTDSVPNGTHLAQCFATDQRTPRLRACQGHHRTKFIVYTKEGKGWSPSTSDPSTSHPSTSELAIQSAFINPSSCAKFSQRTKSLLQYHQSRSLHQTEATHPTKPSSQGNQSEPAQSTMPLPQVNQSSLGSSERLPMYPAGSFPTFYLPGQQCPPSNSGHLSFRPQNRAPLHNHRQNMPAPATYHPSHQQVQTPSHLVHSDLAAPMSRDMQQSAHMQMPSQFVSPSSAGQMPHNSQQSAYMQMPSQFVSPSSAGQILYNSQQSAYTHMPSPSSAHPISAVRTPHNSQRSAYMQTPSQCLSASPAVDILTNSECSTRMQKPRQQQPAVPGLPAPPHPYRPGFPCMHSTQSPHHPAHQQHAPLVEGLHQAAPIPRNLNSLCTPSTRLTGYVPKPVSTENHAVLGNNLANPIYLDEDPVSTSDPPQQEEGIVLTIPSTLEQERQQAQGEQLEQTIPQRPEQAPADQLERGIQQQLEQAPQQPAKQLEQQPGQQPELSIEQRLAYALAQFSPVQRPQLQQEQQTAQTCPIQTLSTASDSRTTPPSGSVKPFVRSQGFVDNFGNFRYEWMPGEKPSKGPMFTTSLDQNLQSNETSFSLNSEYAPPQELIAPLPEGDPHQEKPKRNRKAAGEESPPPKRRKAVPQGLEQQAQAKKESARRHREKRNLVSAVKKIKSGHYTGRGRSGKDTLTEREWDALLENCSNERNFIYTARDKIGTGRANALTAAETNALKGIQAPIFRGRGDSHTQSSSATSSAIASPMVAAQREHTVAVAEVPRTLNGAAQPEDDGGSSDVDVEELERGLMEAAKQEGEVNSSERSVGGKGLGITNVATQLEHDDGWGDFDLEAFGQELERQLSEDAKQEELKASEVHGAEGPHCGEIGRHGDTVDEAGNDMNLLFGDEDESEEE